MLELQRQGCHNINFVTPEHVVPQVLEAIAAAIPRGLQLPIVYNTSAYDSVDSLEVSRDTYLNIMGQYRPAYEVGQIAKDGGVARFAEIDRRPESNEIARAYEAARRVGLWRFD